MQVGSMADTIFWWFYLYLVSDEDFFSYSIFVVAFFNIYSDIYIAMVSYINIWDTLRLFVFMKNT